MLTQEAINEIVKRQDVDGCIECGAKYFHTSKCRHGRGLAADVLYQRLQKRAQQIAPTLQIALQSCHCGRPATGTLWVKYHQYHAIVSAMPACETCAGVFSDPGGRPVGFLPGVITNDTSRVEEVLAKSV